MTRFFESGGGAAVPASPPSDNRMPASPDGAHPVYSLAPGVHACVESGRLVLLDAVRDRYLMLDRVQTPRVMSLLHAERQPVGGPDSGAKDVGPPERAVVEAMWRRGLLAPATGPGCTPLKPARALPTADLTSHDTRRQASFGPRTILRFFLASRRAAQLLKGQPFASVVDHVRERRAMADGKFDFNRARDLVSRFQRLRPFSRRDYLCLFDSLALIEFFHLHRLYPTWVFGVCAEPFQAHCWVQAGGVVLNDTIEVIRHYTPIMAV